MKHLIYLKDTELWFIKIYGVWFAHIFIVRILLYDSTKYPKIKIYGFLLLIEKLMGFNSIA